jgi:hemoglobin-like flavoprotein
MNIELLRSSFTEILEQEPELTSRFYATLFARYPQVVPLFGRNTARQQQEMLGQALMAVLDHLENADWLVETLGALGRKHGTYGVTSEMYDWVGECLLATLADIAGPAWTPAHEKAWSEAYAAIALLMVAGANQIPASSLQATRSKGASSSARRA